MDEGNGLENRRPARVRGFESHPLRSVMSVGEGSGELDLGAGDGLDRGRVGRLPPGHSEAVVGTGIYLGYSSVRRQRLGVPERTGRADQAGADLLRLVRRARRMEDQKAVAVVIESDLSSVVEPKAGDSSEGAGRDSCRPSISIRLSPFQRVHTSIESPRDRSRGRDGTPHCPWGTRRSGSLNVPVRLHARDPQLRMGTPTGPVADHRVSAAVDVDPDHPEAAIGRDRRCENLRRRDGILLDPGGHDVRTRCTHATTNRPLRSTPMPGHPGARTERDGLADRAVLAEPTRHGVPASVADLRPCCQRCSRPGSAPPPG